MPAFVENSIVDNISTETRFGLVTRVDQEFNYVWSNRFGPYELRFPLNENVEFKVCSSNEKQKLKNPKLFSPEKWSDTSSPTASEASRLSTTCWSGTNSCSRSWICPRASCISKSRRCSRLLPRAAHSTMKSLKGTMRMFVFRLKLELETLIYWNF